jgi:hypothetical protein
MRPQIFQGSSGEYLVGAGSRLADRLAFRLSREAGGGWAGPRATSAVALMEKQNAWTGFVTAIDGQIHLAQRNAASCLGLTTRFYGIGAAVIAIIARSA